MRAWILSSVMSTRRLVSLMDVEDSLYSDGETQPGPHPVTVWFTLALYARFVEGPPVSDDVSELCDLGKLVRHARHLSHGDPQVQRHRGGQRLRNHGPGEHDLAVFHRTHRGPVLLHGKGARGLAPHRRGHPVFGDAGYEL